MFQLVFHHDFVRTLRALGTGHPWFRELHDCLTQLGSGDWNSSGLRVKQLHHGQKGGRANVYEARINHGDRLLFGRLPHAHLVVFDVVKHDGVNRCFRRLLRLETEDTAADFPPIRGFVPAPDNDPLVEPADAPETPRLDIAYVATSGFRIYRPPHQVLANRERLEQWCSENRVQAELLLTEEQESVLASPRPLLLSGNAGSGKTTVIAHRLCRLSLAHPRARLLYLTYLPKLAEEAERAFAAVLRAEALPYPDCAFYSLRRLLRTLHDAEADAAPLSDQEPFGESGFHGWWSKQRSRPRGIASADAWAEIRGVVKGRVQDTTRPLLTEEEYLALPLSEGLLPTEMRPTIHRLAGQYQEFLSDSGLYDETDLARRALSRLPCLSPSAAREWTFDAFFCDEAQDLTALELRVLKELWKASRRGRAIQEIIPSSLLIAGDPHQVVYPSAFRWSDVTRFFYEGEVQSDPFESVTLTQNFRSARPILELAERILHGLKRRLLAPFRDSQRQRFDFTPFHRDYAPEGDAPISIRDEEQEMLRILRLLPGSARRIVLTRNRETASRLSAALESGEPVAASGSTLVCAIEEFKGLEADCVILWRYFADASGFWATVSNGRTPRSLFETLTECNRLYVAVTRSRAHFVSFDAPNDPVLWPAIPDFAEYPFQEETPRWLIENQSVASSPAEWLALAMDFEAQQQYAQASKCYRWAGEEKRARGCEARIAEEQGDWERAVQGWFEAEEWEKTICAAERSRAPGDQRIVLYCRAETAELANRWAEAREFWNQLREARRTARAEEQQGNWKQAAAYWAGHEESPERTAFYLRWLAAAMASLSDTLTAPKVDTSSDHDMAAVPILSLQR